jgi:uncharacterized protein YdeI (BOF family)
VEEFLMFRTATAAVLVALMALPAIAAPDRAITPIADARKGTMVTVQGTVEAITDEDEFRLSDATGDIRIYVGPNWVPVDAGESVTVHGFVDDDLGPREIYARQLTRADGSVIAFDHRYE